MFSVKRGTLELVGGRFQLPEQGGPAWFLHVDDGEFAIHNCSLLGPRGAASGGGGLINITGPKGKGSGRILGSFLAGGGSLIRTQHPNRPLLVTDSLLFSTGKVFDLDLSPTLVPASIFDDPHSPAGIRFSTFEPPNPKLPSPGRRTTAGSTFSSMKQPSLPELPPPTPANLKRQSSHAAAGHWMRDVCVGGELTTASAPREDITSSTAMTG
ncbi:MAG: hypothetical protein CM1200mP2_10950 [Planctomycetaceae bacterium]|nr:MAG: hypothetical protein CM1200mP2_10950 [Planctomycetaceae bacterium]